MSFEALGLPADADEATVKARWKELAFQHHPDRGGDASEFVRLKAAYEACLEAIAARYQHSIQRIRIDALRKAASGVQCPRCEGSGVATRRQVGFKVYTTKCRLCNGRGKIQ